MFFLAPNPCTLLVLQALAYLDLLLHLRYEVASLLGLNLIDMCLLQVTEQAFLFGLKRSPLAIALGVLSQLVCFHQLPPGGLELRVLLPQLQELPPQLDDLLLKLPLKPD